MSVFGKLKFKLAQRRFDKEMENIGKALTEWAKEPDPQYAGISPVTGMRYEQPLQDVHPEKDLAFMYAQPGGFLTKLIAPSVYKNMLSDIQENGALSAAGPGWLKDEQALKLLNLEKELEATEKARRVAQEEAKKRAQAIINSADDIKFGPSGRPHIVHKKPFESSGVYERVEIPQTAAPAVTGIPKSETQKKLDELWKKHNYLVGKAQDAANTGHQGAYQLIMEEADAVKQEIYRLSPPDYRLKHGGRLKRR